MIEPNEVNEEIKAKCNEVGRRAILMTAFSVVPGSPRPQFDSMIVAMDFAAAHLNGCPIDFDKLLAFDDSNFLHDVFGVYNCIDRSTGKLGRFWPRCAAKVEECPECDGTGEDDDYAECETCDGTGEI